MKPTRRLAASVLGRHLRGGHRTARHPRSEASPASARTAGRRPGGTHRAPPRCRTRWLRRRAPHARLDEEHHAPRRRPLRRLPQRTIDQRFRAWSSVGRREQFGVKACGVGMDRGVVSDPCTDACPLPAAVGHTRHLCTQSRKALLDAGRPDAGQSWQRLGGLSSEPATPWWSHPRAAQARWRSAWRPSTARCARFARR